MKVAINGLGRIGKQFLLAALEKKMPWDFIINHTGDLDSIVYALKHDSVHPTPKENIRHDGKHVLIGKKKIKVYNILEPEKLPWKEEKIDLVVECTGHFTKREDASKHLKAGAKKVLISAPAKDSDCTIVYGVNSDVLKKEHTIISAGSCTTNCIAPMVKLINDTFKIKTCYFVTTHAYTSTQHLIDSHEKKDPRRGRAAAVDIVPSTSGASQSVIEAVPELKGKIDGYALRVPVVDGSISSIFATIEKPADIKKINNLFKASASGKMKGILTYNTDSIVSSDIIHDASSCIFDATFTSVMGNTISITGWYDNEWGYSCRLVDVAKLILKK